MSVGREISNLHHSNAALTAEVLSLRTELAMQAQENKELLAQLKAVAK